MHRVKFTAAILINPCLEVENFTFKTTPKRGPKHKHQNKSMNKVCKLAATKHRHKTMPKQKIFQGKNFPSFLQGYHNYDVFLLCFNIKALND